MTENFGKIIAMENIRLIYPKKIKLSQIEKMFNMWNTIVILENGDKISTSTVKARWTNKRHGICEIVPDTSKFRRFKSAYLELKP